MGKQKFVFVLGEPRIEASDDYFEGYWVHANPFFTGCAVAEYLCGKKVRKEIEASIRKAPNRVFTAILPLEV